MIPFNKYRYLLSPATYSKTVPSLHDAGHDWDTLSECTWYCFGTLLGESLTRDTQSSNSPALRLLLAVWILYCLVISASYSGNLKAYLTTPSYSKNIDSLQVS